MVLARRTTSSPGPGSPGPDSPAPVREIPDAGAAAIEFAIVAPLVFLLLFWTFQFGWQLFELQSSQAVVQQVARLAASGGSNATTIVHTAVCLAEPATGSGDSAVTGARLTQIRIETSNRIDFAAGNPPVGSDGYLRVTLTFRSRIAGALPVPAVLTGSDGTFTRRSVVRLEQRPLDPAVLSGIVSTISPGTTC